MGAAAAFVLKRAGKKNGMDKTGCCKSLIEAVPVREPLVNDSKASIQVVNPPVNESRFEALLRRSRRLQRSSDCCALHPEINRAARFIVIDWMNQVCAGNNYTRETYYFALCLFDHVLKATSDFPKAKLQLMGSACILIAVKLHESDDHEGITDRLIYLCAEAFSTWHLHAMETRLLRLLNWQTWCFTHEDLMHYYWEVADLYMREDQMHSTKIILDLLVLDLDSLQYEIALLVLAVQVYVTPRLWTRLETHVNGVFTREQIFQPALIQLIGTYARLHTQFDNAQKHHKEAIAHMEKQEERRLQNA